jgi:hypothetical protein
MKKHKRIIAYAGAFTPELEVYSIDKALLELSGNREALVHNSRSTVQ